VFNHIPYASIFKFYENLITCYLSFLKMNYSFILVNKILIKIKETVIMKFPERISGLLFFSLILFLMIGNRYFSFAQKVPVSFNDYHGYTGTVKYIKDIAEAYPGITELMEIGKSNMGRSIYVLAISDMNTGINLDTEIELRNVRKEGVKNVPPMKRHQGKPGQWICGSIHGNEFTGTEVCLYIINKLVSGYDSDQEVTQLVNDKVFYICPIVNPDGVYNSVELGISQRENSMMTDDDNDSKVNEDGPDDLNHDGHITRFRYKDPDGRYIIDEKDSRLMIRLEKNEETTKQRYSVIREDKDNDGDGKRGEDSEAGIDINRNFPEVWFKDDGMQGGSGNYPTSSPEARAIVEFFTNYTNILMAQYYHTSGGFTYRPLGTAPHGNLHPKDIAVYDMIMGKKYLELIGDEIPKAWIYPDSLSRYKEDLKKISTNKYVIERGYEFPKGWRVSYNETADKLYGYGLATDWMYIQYGVYSLSTELWNPEKDITDFPQFKGKDANVQRKRALLKYQDENFEGKLFISWQPFKHPELGEGEIGGWIPKYNGNNAFPGEPLKNVCETHWQYELFRARLLPELVITDVRTETLYSTNNAKRATMSEDESRVEIKKGKSIGRYRIVEVSVNIENKGQLATHIARGAELAGNRQDVVWLVGERDRITYLQGTAFQKIGVLEGQMKIPGYTVKTPPASTQQTRTRSLMPSYPMYQGRRIISYEQPGKQQTGPTREVKWLIAVEGETPLKVIVASQKGGSKEKSLTIK
jgi:hypothetical protein